MKSSKYSKLIIAGLLSGASSLFVKAQTANITQTANADGTTTTTGTVDLNGPNQAVTMDQSGNVTITSSSTPDPSFAEALAEMKEASQGVVFQPAWVYQLNDTKSGRDETPTPNITEPQPSPSNDPYGNYC